MVARLQYFILPLSALEVIRMLIGPAIGIEKIKPTIKPTIDMVIKLSNNVFIFNVGLKESGVLPLNLHQCLSPYKHNQ